MYGIKEVTLPSKKMFETVEIIEGEVEKIKSTDLANGNQNTKTMKCWLSTANILNNKFYTFKPSGEVITVSPSNLCGVWPIIKLSEDTYQKIEKNAIDFNGIKLVNFGEFPQSSVKNMQLTDYKTTGKYYTIKGQKSVEIVIKGQKYCQIDGVWYKVEPITWFVDEENHLLLARNILLSMPIDSSNHFNGEFVNSTLYKYLNISFVKDIIPSKQTINDEDLLLDLTMLNLIKQRLLAEYALIDEDIASKEQLLSEILELKASIEDEMQKSIRLDEKLEELDRIVKEKKYVRR